MSRPWKMALLGWLLAFSAVIASQTPAPPGDLRQILDGLADRTQQYYERFVSIICTEAAHQQQLRFNLAPTGRPRVTVYELSVTRDGEAPGGRMFRVGRTLLSIDGRAVRKHQEPGCTDPKTGSPEPLAFLLVENQKRFRFTINDAAPGGPPGTRVLDFVETPAEPVRIKWAGDCFQAEGGGEQGRVWYDPDTFDVLQVDSRLSKPFSVPLPAGLRGMLQPAVRVERLEATVRFARVKFENPDETALLPESIDTLTVFRGVNSRKTTQKLSNFRRFLAESVVRPAIR